MYCSNSEILIARGFFNFGCHKNVDKKNKYIIILTMRDNYHSKYGKFYASTKWRKLRNQKFADADGLCEMCKKEDRYELGKEVHHIVPIEKDWDRRLDYDNLILLCPMHHNEVHERQSVLQDFLKYWNNQ